MISICRKNFSINYGKAQTTVQTAERKRNKTFKNKGENMVFPLKIEVEEAFTQNLSQKNQKVSRQGSQFIIALRLLYLMYR